MVELRRRKSRVASCRPDFEAFLVEHVVVVSPTKRQGEKKEEDKQTTRAKEKFLAKNFSRVKPTVCIYDAPDSFFADQIGREIVALFVLPQVCRLRD